MYFHGGLRIKGSNVLGMSDFWEVDLETKQESRLPSGPGARFSHAADVDDERFCLSAGRAFKPSGSWYMLSDLHCYDHNSKQWSDVTPSNYYERVYHSLNLYDGDLYQFGGYRSLVSGGKVVAMVDNDLLKTELTSSQWYQFNNGSSVPVRFQHAAEVEADGGNARKLLFIHGSQAQTGSILQLFTNRANLSLLFQAVGNAGAGVYSVVYYGVEAVWSISRAIAPMVNNEVAKASGKTERMAITSGYMNKTILFTLPLVLLACVVPESVYAWIFGIEGVAAPLKLLAPGMIAGAISSILAHHLSGVGLHKGNAITSGIGLSVLITVGVYLLPISSVEDAAIAASCAYVAQATGLFIVWRLEKI